MARSRSRGSSRAAAPRGSKREAKSKKVVAVPVAEVEVVEEGKGMGIDDGVVIVTTVLLIASFFLVDYVLGNDYAKGFLFKG
jgi:hypothetical protein